MTQTIKTERRWLRSLIVASAEPLPNFPWMRGERRRPAALQDKAAAPVVLPVPHVPVFGRMGAIAAR